MVLEYHKWQLIGITLYITKQINISKYIFFITHTSHNNIHIFIDRLVGDIFLFITHIYLDKGGTFTNMSHLLIFFTEEGDSRTQEMEKKCLLLQQHVHEMEV